MDKNICLRLGQTFARAGDWIEMNRKIIIWGAVILTLSLVITACGPARPAVPTPTEPDPGPVLTGVAQTAQSRLTEMAQQTPSPEPATETPLPSPTPSPTPDVNPEETPSDLATPTIAPRPGGTVDNSVMASETIPDGSQFQPGAAFVKTWRFLNNGSTTWTRGYELVHVGDNLMGAVSPVPVPFDVPPNQVVDINVNMTAPNQAGAYRGYWRIRNSQGEFFGDRVWVEIAVSTTAATQPAGTDTPVPGTTPVVTPTPGDASGVVSNVTLTFDNPDVTGACPHTYNLISSFSLSENATVTYQLVAGSNTPGFQFDLPTAQTVTLSAGAHTRSFTLRFTNSVTGWVQMSITAPNAAASEQVNFSLTCQ
jgi:hypothetical protein